MGILIHTVIASLDGYVEDPGGRFDWAEPDEEVHAFVNDVERPVGTHLYGRRMYETMALWERPPDLAERPPFFQEFAAIWQAADKIVYSRKLQAVTTASTTLERAFDHPDAVRGLKAAAERDLTVGGPDLAGQAIAAGLVDELRLFLVPVVVGGGKRSLPEDVRVDLELLDERPAARLPLASAAVGGLDREAEHHPALVVLGDVPRLDRLRLVPVRSMFATKTARAVKCRDRRSSLRPRNEPPRHGRWFCVGGSAVSIPAPLPFARAAVSQLVPGQVSATGDCVAPCPRVTAASRLDLPRRRSIAAILRGEGYVTEAHL